MPQLRGNANLNLIDLNQPPVSPGTNPEEGSRVVGEHQEGMPFDDSYYMDVLESEDIDIMEALVPSSIVLYPVGGGSIVLRLEDLEQSGAGESWPGESLMDLNLEQSGAGESLMDLDLEQSGAGESWPGESLMDLDLEDLVRADEDGASNNVVENLPMEELRKEDLEGGSMCCAVCIEELVVGVVVSRLPCGHCFHKDCIVTWLRIKTNCPLWRTELSTAEGEPESRRV